MNMTFFKPALSRLPLGMTLALGLVAGAVGQTTMSSGTILIPEVLWPYMGGIEHIAAA